MCFYPNLPPVNSGCHTSLPPPPPILSLQQPCEGGKVRDCDWSSITVVLNLCYSDAFELQLPETPVSTVGGEGFWELQSKTPE